MQVNYFRKSYIKNTGLFSLPFLKTLAVQLGFFRTKKFSEVAPLVNRSLPFILWKSEYQCIGKNLLLAKFVAG